MILTLVSVLCLFAASAQGVCQKPSVTSDTYSTSSTTLSTKTVYLAEFSVKCANDEEQNLYAEINGVLVPVAKSAANGKYQVSWSSEHKEATRGDIPIKVYDEEGYAAFRKAQRSADKVSTVEPLSTIILNHPGARKDGLFVQTEFISAAVALVVWWIANSAKGKIME